MAFANQVQDVITLFYDVVLLLHLPPAISDFCCWLFAQLDFRLIGSATVDKCFIFNALNL
jgi:hypothetical protein